MLAAEHLDGGYWPSCEERPTFVADDAAVLEAGDLGL